MHIKIVNSHTHNRVALHNGIPHKTPITMIVMPTTECNFKCFFCVHHEGALNLDTMRTHGKYMTSEIATRLVDSCKRFPKKIKKITISGLGEPLMNRGIVDIVHILKKANISDSVSVVTNGALLDERVSNGFIDAGLDLLRVSIQGLDNQQYRSVTKQTVDFKRIVANVRYYYQNKKHNMSTYVKIIDQALGKYSEEEFYNIFDGICDEVAVEHVVPIFSHISDKSTIGIYGKKPNNNVEVCNYPFYSCMIMPNGDVVSCCAEKTQFFGSIINEELYDIWNGKQRKDFLIRQLNGREKIDVCKNCGQPDYMIRAEELLDSYIEQIAEQINSKWDE